MMFGSDIDNLVYENYISSFLVISYSADAFLKLCIVSRIRQILKNLKVHLVYIEISNLEKK